jgi:hypothetical protein
MTGYKSKKAAARDKLLDDDDTQVYQDHDDALTIAYQSGYYDGKKAAAQKPTKYSFRAHWEADGCIGVVAAIERLDGGVHLLKDTIDAPQEPWRESASDYERGVIDGRQMQAQSSVDKAVNAMTQRTWVGLTDEEIITAYETSGHKQPMRPQDVFAVASLARAIEAKLKEKNNAA